MSDTKFTRGPWVVDALADGRPMRITAPYESPHRKGGIVQITRWNAITLPSSEEGKANAHLISAAPDMFAALEFMYENGDGYDAREMARNALAKARGQA